MEPLVLIFFGFIVFVYIITSIYAKNSQKNMNNRSEKEKMIEVSRKTTVENTTNKEEKDFKKEISYKDYQLPSIKLLDKIPLNQEKSEENQIKTKENIEKIENKLKQHKIEAKVIEVYAGPIFTTYALSLKSGTKIDRISKIIKEIEKEIEAPIINLELSVNETNNVGLITKNKEMHNVNFKELLTINQKKEDILEIPFGKNIYGKEKFYSLKDLKHIYINGSTGTGKTMLLNSIIMSLLLKTKPNEAKLLLIDTKRIEFGFYNGVPHLLTPVVTDPRKASMVLKKVVAEMERRYDVFEKTRTKNIEIYNELVEKKNAKLPEDEKMQKMPYIVVIVDELADLMLVAGKEVEDSIMRITQMAHTVGIYLIISTSLNKQNKTMTTIINNNFSTVINLSDNDGVRDIAFYAPGDMIINRQEIKKSERIQGIFISDREIERVVEFIFQQQKLLYGEEFYKMYLKEEAKEKSLKQTLYSNDEEYDDPLYNDIVKFVIETQKASASLIQRRFMIGYNRASKIVDLLEERGIIGPQEGSKPREVLVKQKSKKDE